MNTTPKAIVGFIAFALVVFLAVSFSQKGAQPASAAPRIDSFEVSSGFFIVTGLHLSKVDIWAIPTGTGMTDRDATRIAYAALATSTPDVEVWTAPVPTEKFLAAQIFVQGYNDSGQSVRMIFGAQGATEIHDALWGSEDEATLKIGETATIQGIAFTLQKITEDSRCPQDVQCIWAGRVVAEFKAVSRTTSQTLVISTDKTVAFAGYDIKISDVTPAKAQSTIPSANYTVTLSLVGND